MSHYKEYAKEYEDSEVLEDENGFCVYKKVNATAYYITEIYVIPAQRRAGIASKYAKEVESIAQKDGANTLFGSVCLEAKNPTDSLKALLAYGFVFSHQNNTLLFFKKEI